MTKLDIANKFRRRSGTPGYFVTNATFNALASETGEGGDLVDMVDQAYLDILIHFSTWLLQRDEFTFDTVSGTQEYISTAIDSDFASWKTDDFSCYLKATGSTDEQRLTYRMWDDFRLAYLHGSLRDSTGRPTIFSVKPDKSIIFYPTPDDVYTIPGELFKVPDAMALDTDEPAFDSRYHWAIVWRALQLFGADSDEPNKEMMGAREYRRILNRMSQQYLPKFSMGGPLV